MPRIRVLPYRQGSRSAKALATALGGKVLKLQGSTYTPRPSDIIINWGNTTPQCQTSLYAAHLVNTGHIVRNVSNKLNFFNLMKEKQLDNLIPKFWTDPDEIPDDAFPVVCRTVLAGHSGDGIHLASSRDDLVTAPLYTQYVKKKDEYRVHVGRTGSDSYITLSLQKKSREASNESPNWQVRNRANGFVYTRANCTPPLVVLDVAEAALEASGLDFGAVDVIWNEHQQRAYVLEINSAPGLEGQTVSDYANYFKDSYL